MADGKPVKRVEEYPRKMIFKCHRYIDNVWHGCFCANTASVL
jgi:hypothetical protein